MFYYREDRSFFDRIDLRVIRLFSLFSKFLYLDRLNSLFFERGNYRDVSFLVLYERLYSLNRNRDFLFVYDIGSKSCEESVLYIK